METSIFITNRTQAVRLPTAMRFDDSVKKVNVRIVGHERILSPVGKSWDSFFLAENTVSDDFMADRENAYQSERESL